MGGGVFKNLKHPISKTRYIVNDIISLSILGFWKIISDQKEISIFFKLQDFGINILSYLNPVKSDGILDVLVEPEINEFDTAEFSDDVESPPSPIVFKRKPGTYWLISN